MFSRKLMIVIVLMIAVQSSLPAYEQLLFKPLTAAVFEPRIGCLYQFGNNSDNDEKLRLDIGASFDLAGFEPGKDSSELRFGTDWFTFTRLRSEGNMKFPVETSDYFFGVNSSYKSKLFGLDFYGRLRLAHISSHLVDGMANKDTFRISPFVYSREFADLTGAVIYKNIRFYLGLTYVFSHLPKNTEEIVPQIGIDLTRAISEMFYFKMGLDMRVPGFDFGKYSGNTQIGLLVRTSENLGIMVNYTEFHGRSIHGMFWDRDDNYRSIGFQVIYYGINF